MHCICIMWNFKINAQFCIHSLADRNVGHCVELTFRVDNLGKFLKFNSDENSFSFRPLLPEIHPACPQKGQFYKMTYV